MSSREALRGVFKALQRCAFDGVFSDDNEEACGVCGTLAGDCDSIDGEDGSDVCPGRGARAALTAWNERERLGADEYLRTSVACVAYEPEARGGKARDILDILDAHLFGTPTSGDTPTDGEAGNPTAEAASRGSDLSPSSVTTRACEPWCGTPWHTHVRHDEHGEPHNADYDDERCFCSPACRDAGRALAPVGAELEPMRGEVAEDVHETAGERNAREALEPEDAPSLAHYGAAPPPEVPGEKCGRCGGSGRTYGDGNGGVYGYPCPCPTCGGSGRTTRGGT